MARADRIAPPLILLADRFVRDSSGKVTALSIGEDRVWDLRFTRTKQAPRYTSGLNAMKSLLASLLGATLLVAQTPPAPPEYKGIPARATPADYQFQAKAGSATIAAEFTGHSLPTAEGPLTTEDFVAVEIALYGPAGERLKISSGDFSLRLGKKLVPSQPFASVFSSLKDPEYIEPDFEPKSEKQSKTSMNSGGGGGGKQKGDSSNGPPPPVKIPVPVMRAMAQRVQKAALPEGDRALPQAGLVFFGYHGKTTNLQSVELIYEGPAGKTVIQLHQ